MTIFQLEEGLDSGPVALSRARRSCRATRAAPWASGSPRSGQALLIEAFDQAEAGVLELRPQSGGGRHLRGEDRPGGAAPRPGAAASELERIVRALTPGIGTFLELEDGERLGVEAARVADAAVGPGAVVVEDGRLLVGCAEGALELLRVRPRADGRCRPPTTCANAAANAHRRTPVRLCGRAPRVRAGCLPRVPGRGGPADWTAATVRSR